MRRWGSSGAIRTDNSAPFSVTAFQRAPVGEEEEEEAEEEEEEEAKKAEVEVETGCASSDALH